jgi:acyl carrier protein
VEATEMMDQHTDMDTELRKRVFDSMVVLLVRMLRPQVPVTEDTLLMDELGLSSSLGLELFLELEEELEIQINVEDLDQDLMRTVGDMADFIAANSEPV